jgi:hypothetical protein
MFYSLYSGINYKTFFLNFKNEFSKKLLKYIRETWREVLNTKTIPNCWKKSTLVDVMKYRGDDQTHRRE